MTAAVISCGEAPPALHHTAKPFLALSWLDLQLGSSGFHREQVGEQTWGDVGVNEAPQGPSLECRKGKGCRMALVRTTSSGCCPCGASSLFGLAVGFAARTTGMAVVIPVIILHKQG